MELADNSGWGGSVNYWVEEGRGRGGLEGEGKGRPGGEGEAWRKEGVSGDQDPPCSVGLPSPALSIPGLLFHSSLHHSSYPPSFSLFLSLSSLFHSFFLSLSLSI